ncbi:FxsA family protein [Candidatus Sumerlaeota bacterium]|nr:FxsA family protein [Candidatus Sumerlaeota bacterium]
MIVSIVFWKLVIVFIVLPVLELWLIFKLAHATSWGFTFLVVIGTGILGTTMAKRQGWKIWTQINERLQRGEMPGDILLDGLLLLIGGILLITPGLITDTVGFLLLIPLTRSLFRQYIGKRIERAVKRGAMRFSFYSNATPPPYREDAVDVEWEETTPESEAPPRPRLPNEK